MAWFESLLEERGAARIVRAHVVDTGRSGIVVVRLEDERANDVRCDVLRCAEGLELRLAADDSVVVWLLPDDSNRGVILGRIGPSHTAPESAPESEAEDRPDELVIDARKSLTLKCGDGSITIREDGKILIKGKDLVSHAQRLNRIKGGAVQIN